MYLHYLVKLEMLIAHAWETVAGWAPADLYFVSMPAPTALPPNANFALSDWSYWSSGLIYVSRSAGTVTYYQWFSLLSYWGRPNKCDQISIIFVEKIVIWSLHK